MLRACSASPTFLARSRNTAAKLDVAVVEVKLGFDEDMEAGTEVREGGIEVKEELEVREERIPEIRKQMS